MTETQYRNWWSEHRDGIEASDDVRVDVFLRSLGAPTATRSTQAAVLEQLDELEEIGRIDRFTVQVWGDQIYPDERCAQSPVGRFLQSKVMEFEQWGERTHGVTLPFESTVCKPFVTDREYHCIKLPRICLGVYADGDLSGVVPCEFGPVNVPVREYLTAVTELSSGPLEVRERPESLPTAESI
ncbi:hypothetical protein BRC91_06910 [Halobacteriales archaeon QS_4_62_28]|nr:MAG: hypothetical protein BRC91_06910 [Halobacteriales archaeon QS_4_62_28]